MGRMRQLNCSRFSPPCRWRWGVGGPACTRWIWLWVCAAGAGLRLAVYLKGKNAKRYRHNVEYGSARWGTHDEYCPLHRPVFQNNVILTQTERLTMSSRPKNPKYARNKNVLVIGGFRQRQDPLLAQAQPDADAQLLCSHRPQGHYFGGVRQDAPAGGRPSWARTASR